MQNRAAEVLSFEPDFTTDTMAPAFEYPTESIVSYAQTHEDVLLWRALHRIQRGFYIDVGAHDPVALSVTKAFYDRGWSGINVEPISRYAENFRKERPRDRTFRVALGQTAGITTIYDFGDTGLSTVVRKIADGHATAGIKATIEHRVPVTTLAALVDGLGDREVHFLKIDVEGYEQQVLAGANFQKVRPWIVLVEAVEPRSPIPTHGVWEPLLLEAGYVFAYFDGLNRFYVAREHLDLKRYFSVPVNIFDPFRDYDMVRLSTEREQARAELNRYASEANALRQAQVELNQRTSMLEARLFALTSSSSWRLTEPLRRLAGKRSPQTRRNLRRVVKTAWWAMTPWRIPMRIRRIWERNGAPKAGVTLQKPSESLPDDNGNNNRSIRW
jgi:FkbM family methyltransferase